MKRTSLSSVRRWLLLSSASRDEDLGGQRGALDPERTTTKTSEKRVFRVKRIYFIRSHLYHESDCCFTSHTDADGDDCRRLRLIARPAAIYLSFEGKFIFCSVVRSVGPLE